MIILTSLNPETTQIKIFDKVAINYLKRNILAVKNITSYLLINQKIILTRYQMSKIFYSTDRESESPFGTYHQV